MEKVKAYFMSSYDELVNKVSWPTWEELRSSTIIVLVATLIFAVAIYLMDLGFQNILEFVYKLFN
ncbi:MAG: preprotein translocase subunit SecE [Bacteroidota bacterium]|nr:preprotein translocase subunit SecE [Bacteroidota bacterium]MDX5430736.1 preprotein translocase subunit SecE [Bacteroidota bacterium]MDX5447182.1 preprotein translocase subunit SecE [Bacteroidota bacterium]MDX5469483.1 preprotein translocase subunit SecE [Bacteroidota bacterium]